MVANIKLEVLTPTHIGMGSEKKLLKGIDFIYKNGEYLILSNNKILSQLNSTEIQLISGFLSEGNFQDFVNYLEKKKLLSDTSIARRWQSSFQNANEIRQTYHDGKGRFFIPGSSIKGSLRSIIGTALKPDNEISINYEELMGRIDNNLMRFLQVTDCYVDQDPGIYPVKVFSADILVNRKVGMWKDRSRGGHVIEFNNTNFVTFYEMLTDGVNSNSTKGELRINWGGSDFVRNSRGEKDKPIPNIDLFNKERDLEWLWHIIKTNTSKFLEQEIHFYETYQNDDIADNFFEELDWLKQENEKNPNSCILRLGANVGWHSITGNWKFTDFANAVETNRGRQIRGRELAYKTRKLGFDIDGDGELRFFLPGFVKLIKS